MKKIYKPLSLYFIYFITHYYAQEISSVSLAEFNITSSSTVSPSAYATEFHIAQLEGGNTQDTISDYNQVESTTEFTETKKSPLNNLEAGILSASGILVVAGITVGILVWKNKTRRRNLRNQLGIEEDQRKDDMEYIMPSPKKRFSFPSISGCDPTIHNIISEVTDDNISDITDDSSFSGNSRHEQQQQQQQQRISCDQLSIEKTPPLRYSNEDIIDQQPQSNKREKRGEGARFMGEDREFNPSIPTYPLQKFLRSDLPFAQKETPRDFDDRIIKSKKPMQINLALDPNIPIKRRNFVDLVQEVERRPIQSPLDLPQDCYIPLKDAVGPRLISRAEVMADPIRRQGQDELALWEENCRKKKTSKESNRKHVALSD